MTKKNIKKKIPQPLTIDDLIFVVGNQANSRIKRTFLKTIKYGGNLTKAMKEEGYSQSSINNPGLIKKSKDWQEALDHYFPPNEVIALERKLWKQNDWRAWANSLDRIAKMKGHFIKKTEQNIHKVTEYRQASDKDLKNIIDAEYEPVESTTDGGEERIGIEGDVEETP